MVETRSHSLFARVRAHLRSERPPKWWQELLFIGAIYWLYSLVRNAVPGHEVGAYARARHLISIEQTLHINVEHTLNNFVNSQHWLAYCCDYYYATLHFIVTIAVLVWMFVRHPMRYRPIRTVLIWTNLIALLGFWFISVAPPRLLPGYVDTVLKFHTWGSFESPGLANASNQFAAMPSLHIGWSLWCALAIITLAKRPWVRVLGALYPLATLFVILGTANHYMLDAVGGVVTLCLAIGVQRLLSGQQPFRRDVIVLPDLATDRELTRV
ncbi:MAG TPA: phosphatase PAP2 family protein [Mycobacteriales bacterium]|nr:phosphatase PAP2 family protein [Mycobacteriales bacterium]